MLAISGDRPMMLCNLKFLHQNGTIIIAHNVLLYVGNAVRIVNYSVLKKQMIRHFAIHGSAGA